MKFAGRHRQTAASAVVLTVGIVALAILAFSSKGYPERRVNLNDGGIWVTSSQDQLFGRLNKPAGSLDAAMNPVGEGGPTSAALDTRQTGAAVVGWDRGAGTLYPIDVTTAAIASDHAVPVSSAEEVALAGGTLAVLDPASGKIWAQRVDPEAGIADLTGVDPSAEPVAEIEVPSTAGAQGVALAVSVDGTITAVSTTGDVVTVSPTTSGFEDPQPSEVDTQFVSAQATTVGSKLVVLDTEAGAIVLPDGQTVRVDGLTPEARLQAPSPSGSTVVVSTSQALLSFDLDTGASTVLFSGADGKPAQPVWLGSCVYAAWAGAPGIYQHACGGGLATPGNVRDLKDLNDPVFRVNRSSIVLNDLSTGYVVDLESGQRVDNWQDVKPPPISQDDNEDNSDNPTPNTKDLPPKPADDTLGARPGRTTVLHLLDNDSDPQGYILSIKSISDLDDPAVRVAIAPDGQTVQVALPPDSSGAHFKYTVDDGKGLSGIANVDVRVRLPSENDVPVLRTGFAARTWNVAAGGTLSLPVLGDWRDPDGDPVVLTQAAVETGSVTTTSDGRVAFSAPPQGGPTTVAYKVSDGYPEAEPAEGTIDVNVLSPTSTSATSALAEPDIARGVVGQPITVHPLDNDLPGADPSNPAAVIALAGQIASPEGATVTTDPKTGVVTILAGRPGTFQLTYAAAYGNAPFSEPGMIRVDVAKPPTADEPLVAMPDTSVLHGQAPNVVDVLANDFNPSGRLLVVQDASSVDDTGQLQVAVVQGHWLRINALTPTLSPNPQLIRYTITDGVSATTTGEVIVTQLPPVLDDRPVPQDDYAIVRAGDSASIAVLDNDTNPSGAPITLAPVVAGAPNSGQLVVTSASGTGEPLGAAYVSGQTVRFVPPPSVTTQQEVIVDYVAQDPAGNQATGRLHITITPAPTEANPDLAPSPQPIEARLVAGDRISITVPTYGIDPDGDSVTLVGIGSAPALGRVVGISATAITYEAFPTSAGTDTFSYRVIDPYDQTGETTIRIAVVPPGEPQPPIAADDQVIAEPGSQLEVDVLANDIYATNDSLTISPGGSGSAEFPDGVTLTSPTGPLVVDVPPADGKPLVVVYALTNGLGSPSTGTLTIRGQDGYNNPPRAFDVFARPEADASSVTVDLLARAFDPEGDAIGVSPIDGAEIKGDSVTLPLTGHAHAVPFEISDSAGGYATAVVHLPAVGVGGPYVKPGQTIAIDKNSTATIKLSDYLIDPAGKSVRLTTTDQISAAPSAGLSAINTDETELELTSRNDYVGPAAISFEVTNGSSLKDPEGETAFVTVPVQVGPETPFIRCPTGPLTLVAGGAPVSVDVVSICHVWAPKRADLPDMEFGASWEKRADGVSIDGSGSHTLTLAAAGSARPGATGVISVTVPGTDATPSSLSVVVSAAPPPTVSPIVIDGFKVGATATVDLAAYVSSRLRDPEVTVVSIGQTSGGDAEATQSGSKVSITPGADTSGVLTFSITVSDVADATRDDRYATGSITMNVLNVPDAPTAVTPGRSVLSRMAELSWATPASNGAPIEYYTVESGSFSQQCAASPCRLANLTNGQDYRFTVKAHNLVGDSAASAPSAVTRPNAVPVAPINLTQTNPQDHTLTLKWSAGQGEGTPPVKYVVTWADGGTQTVTAPSTTATPRGLDNNSTYTFTVVAYNELGPGPGATVTGQSAGKPAPPGAPTFTATNDTAGNTRVARLDWAPVDPNGIAPTSYSIERSGGSGTRTLTTCDSPTATTCLDPGIELDGTTYTYVVTARNAAAATDAPNHTSAPGAPTTMEATATPEPITDIVPTVVNATPHGQVPVTFTVGASHGSSSTVTCTYSGGSCGSASFPTGGQTGAQMTLQFTPGWTGSFTLIDCNGSAQSDAQAGSACNGGTAASAASNGPPNTPTNPSCPAADGSTFRWSAPAPVGARTVSYYSLGGATSGTTTATQVVLGVVADGGQRTVTVVAVDSAGVSSAPLNVTCQNPPPPTPSIFAFQGAAGTSTIGSCTTTAQNCHWLSFTLSGNFPSGSYTWQCISNGVVSYTSSSSFSFTAGATYNGSNSANRFCIWGAGYTEQIRINGITSNGVPHQ